MARNWTGDFPIALDARERPHGPTAAGEDVVDRKSFLPLDCVHEDGPIEGGGNGLKRCVITDFISVLLCVYSQCTHVP